MLFQDPYSALSLARTVFQILAEPLQVARADRQIGQGLQVVAGLAEGGGAGRLADRLAEHAGAIALGAQGELVVQREKKPPDTWGSTTARAAA